MPTGPAKLQSLIHMLSRAVLGKEDIIQQMVTGLVAGGHILFEDVPGVGKTTLVKGLARSLGCVFRRVQCTPDLLPTDITGIPMYNTKTGQWSFQKGPIFTQVLLVDEINRTSPKTQSALLEAMEERQVTVDGATYTLEDPFFVLATQNPLEHEGTYPLPESQMDRFTMKLSLGYPAKIEEIRLLTRGIHKKTWEYVDQVMESGDFLGIKQEIEHVHVADNLLNYAAELSLATRSHQKIELGISPRGTIHLVKCAMANAYIANRDYVLPDDLQQVFFPVFGHRLVMDRSSFFEEISAENVLQEILAEVKVPGNTGGR